MQKYSIVYRIMTARFTGPPRTTLKYHNVPSLVLEFVLGEVMTRNNECRTKMVAVLFESFEHPSRNTLRLRGIHHCKTKT